MVCGGEDKKRRDQPAAMEKVMDKEIMLVAFDFNKVKSATLLQGTEGRNLYRGIRGFQGWVKRGEQSVGETIDDEDIRSEASDCGWVHIR
jgi:hypothetical protein